MGQLSTHQLFATSHDAPPMLLTYFLPSRPVSMTLPRRWRLRLPDLWLSRCFLPAWRRFNLPEAVTRKRFFDPLCVLIFGIVLALKHREPWRHSLSQKARKKGTVPEKKRGQSPFCFLRAFCERHQGSPRFG